MKFKTKFYVEDLFIKDEYKFRSNFRNKKMYYNKINIVKK